MPAKPPATVVPAPPEPFDPLTEVWKGGVELWRCHDLALAANSYNRTGSISRFRPITAASRRFVPTAYVADSVDAAISEGPFHDLPVAAGPKNLSRAVVDKMALSPLVVARDLTLISLRGHGVRRLRATQGNLIEPGRDEYPATAPWGISAHRWEGSADGMIWVSRQFPGGLAMMLFGDRVGSAIQLSGRTLPLQAGQGFEYLAAAANAADVTLVDP